MKGLGPLTRRQQLETGLLIALGFLFFAYGKANWDFVWVAGILVLIALVAPILFYPMAFLWFGLARVLAYLSSNIFLILLFFVLITPIGLVRKWMGIDALRLNGFKKNKDSVLHKRQGIITAGELKNPF